MEGNFLGIFPKGSDNWFELSGGSRNRGFEKSGFYCTLQQVLLSILNMSLAYSTVCKMKYGFSVLGTLPRNQITSVLGTPHTK